MSNQNNTAVSVRNFDDALQLLNLGQINSFEIQFHTPACADNENEAEDQLIRVTRNVDNDKNYTSVTIHSEGDFGWDTDTYFAGTGSLTNRLAHVVDSHRTAYAGIMQTITYVVHH